MFIVVEVPDDKATLAREMFGKSVTIHEPEAGWLIYGANVVTLSLEYPGEE